MAAGVHAPGSSRGGSVALALGDMGAADKARVIPAERGSPSSSLSGPSSPLTNQTLRNSVEPDRRSPSSVVRGSNTGLSPENPSCIVSDLRMFS